MQGRRYRSKQVKASKEALEKAAEDGVKRIVVQAGTYRPPSPQQALIWFNKRHDGILLEAEGEVILTAANPEVAEEGAESFPAIVNHVVYFGHGIGPKTSLRGFKITGANDFVTAKKGPDIQPDFPNRTAKGQLLSKTLFFYTDGGGIKVYANSAPTIENCEIFGNYSKPCGAGISIEQRGFNKVPVTIRNCIFRNNRVPMTGSAIDLLDMDHKLGSSAVIENCLFLENLSNEPRGKRRSSLQTWSQKNGHSALTVFPPSRVTVRNCTFVGNRNGVDDLGSSSIYSNCIFWNNTAPGGWATGQRYELDIHQDGTQVSGCMISGGQPDLKGKIDLSKNNFNPPDPQFDENYNPKSEAYHQTGYRSGATP